MRGADVIKSGSCLVGWVLYERVVAATTVFRNVLHGANAWFALRDNTISRRANHAFALRDTLEDSGSSSR